MDTRCSTRPGREAIQSHAWRPLAMLSGLLVSIVTGCGDDSRPASSESGDATEATSNHATPPSAGDLQRKLMWPEEVRELPVKVAHNRHYRRYAFGAEALDLNAYIRIHLDRFVLPEHDADVQEVWRVSAASGTSPAQTASEHLTEFYPDLEGDDRKAREADLAEKVETIRRYARALRDYEQVAFTETALRKAFVISNKAEDRALQEKLMDEFYPAQLEAGWTPYGAAMRMMVAYIGERDRRHGVDSEESKGPDFEAGNLEAVRWDTHFRNKLIDAETRRIIFPTGSRHARFPIERRTAIEQALRDASTTP